MLMEELIRDLARQEAEKLYNEKFTKQHHETEHITLKEAKEKYDLYGATLYRHVARRHLSLIKLGGKSFLIRKEVEKLFVKIK